MNPMLHEAIRWVSQFPWERWLVTGTSITAAAERDSASTELGPGPGCTAADEAIVALGHLRGLARGRTGFGVLRVSKERLEAAASAAAQIGEHGLASDYRALAVQLPSVHNSAGAAAIAERLEPLIYDKAWDLGRGCGRMTREELTQDIMSQARQRVRDRKARR